MVKYEMSDRAKQQGFYLESLNGTRIWHTGSPDLTYQDAFIDLKNAGIPAQDISDSDGTNTVRVSPLNFQKAAEILKFYF